MRVAGRDIDTPLFLSPMVDVTDAPFRSIAREWGADVTCSEMVGAHALVKQHARTWRTIEPWPGEHPYGVQVMGGDPLVIAQSVRDVAAWSQRSASQGESARRVAFVDLNLGCPSPKVLAACAGGFLTRDPKRAGRVVGAAVEAAKESGIPAVTVKMRLGHDREHLTFLDVGAEVQAAGAAWVTLHGRTVVQGYSGKADWDAIARLVDHLDIPVVGNGDVTGPASAVAMREQTHCAGLFIGRAAMHDPTVFRRLRAALDGEHVAGRDPTVDDGPALPQRLASLRLYLDRASQLPVAPSLADLRRQATRFVQGARGAKRLRVAVGAAPDLATLRRLAAPADGADEAEGGPFGSDVAAAA